MLCTYPRLVSVDEFVHGSGANVGRFQAPNFGEVECEDSAEVGVIQSAPQGREALGT